MVDEWSDTRIHGLEAVSEVGRVAKKVRAPFRMEGNAFGPRGLGLKLVNSEHAVGAHGEKLPALVNMDGEEDMTELRAKPQLHWQLEYLQCLRRWQWIFEGRRGGQENTVLLIALLLLLPKFDMPRNGLT